MKKFMKFLRNATFCYNLLLLQATIINAIPIDNGVEGEPEIECGATSITISFNTRNPFEGHIYVKGLSDEKDCRSDGNGQQRTGSINVAFDHCNMKRSRSLNPSGIFVGTTVIISFHPKFETKVDRAYKTQCFYMEAAKTVYSQLDVSGLTTLLQTQNVPMPVCRYEILQDGAAGTPVKFAIVGQPVFHKWTCDTETINTFCMRVYGCFVDDGHGDRVDLLDEKGCAVDKFLLNNLEYISDLMVGKESHVFKYADRVALFFQCQIEITIKESSQCPVPSCPDPAKGRRRRGRSLAADRNSSSRAVAVQQLRSNSGAVSGVLDVFTELSAIDADGKTGAYPNQFESVSRAAINKNDVCMSAVAFDVFIAFVVFLAMLLSSFIGCICTKAKQKGHLCRCC